MKTKLTWACMALGLAIILGLSGCNLIQQILHGLQGDPPLSEANFYYTEVGIRAENIRATCRKVCMDGMANGDSLVFLPTGDTLTGPFDANSFNACITICNDNSELSPEFISLEQSHFQTAIDLKQDSVQKLSQKWIILFQFPLFTWDIVAPLLVPTFPPIGGGDCGMSTCLGHVHILQTEDPLFRIISPVRSSSMSILAEIQNDNSETVLTMETDSQLYAGAYRQSTVEWDSICDNGLAGTSLILKITRTGGGAHEISSTPIWFNACLAGLPGNE